MATCNPNELAGRASCFFCLPSGMYYALKLAILARWLKSVSPGADTSVAALMADASAGCVACPPGAQLGPIRLALICNATSGSGGDPPGTPTGLLIDASGSTTADISMSWTNNGAAETSVQIWKSINGGVYALYATIAGGSTTYHDVAGIPANDYWEYKVRGVNANGSSAFSVPAGAANGHTDFVSVVVSFPFLDVDFADFDVSNNPNITTLSLPRLKRLNGSGNLNGPNCPNLASLSVSVLQFVGGGIDFTSANLLTVSAPNLVSVGSSGAGGLGFSSNVNLTSASFPALITVTDDVDFSNCTALATVTMTALQSSNNLSFSSCTPLTSLSLPSLVTVGIAFFCNNCAALTSISAPVLTDITSGNLNFSVCPSLTSVTFTVLALAGGNLDGHGCTSLATISFPALIHVVGDFDISGCTAMTTASFPSGVSFDGAFNAFGCTSLTSISFAAGTGFIANVDCHGCSALMTVSLSTATFGDFGQLIDFRNDILNQASVDGILHRGVVSGDTTLDFELNSPGNSPPSAGGLVDKTTLIGNGCTVNTN